MPEAIVTIDAAALAEVLRGPSSPVRGFLDVAGEKIRVGARNRCPRSDRAGEHVQDAIVARRTDVNGEPAVTVGTFAPEGVIGRAMFLHEGTPAHPIRARNAKALRFHWARIGADVVVPRRGWPYTGFDEDGTFFIGKGYVWHPGTKPVPFLLDGAREAGFGV